MSEKPADQLNGNTNPERSEEETQGVNPPIATNGTKEERPFTERMGYRCVNHWTTGGGKRVTRHGGHGHR